MDNSDVKTQPLPPPNMFNGSVYINQTESQHVPPNTFGLNQTFANQNKWIAHFPIEDVIGGKYKNLDLHVTRFSLPQLAQTTMEVSYRGYSKEVPSKVLNAGTKEFTIDYIVDSDWRNYRSLYAWISGYLGTLNPTSSDKVDGILPADYLPLRIYLLGPYKKKIVQFLFTNAWIKVFNDIQLDVNQAGEVTHSFTCAYEEFYIEDV